MKHGHPQRSQTHPPGGMALLRLVAALAVMLLAVLPHATLAASALHREAPAVSTAIATSHAHPAGHQAQAPTPCHDDDKQGGKASPGMPSCCILGCGLLAASPAVTLGAVATGWRQLSPEQAAVMAETAPEPAERPPRRPML